MGMDITMHIVRNGEIYENHADIYKGRNSEWFSNLRDQGWDDIYDKLPCKYGWDKVASEDLLKKYNKEKGYFDFFHISVRDYNEWYRKYNPQKRAGWVTTYDMWRMKNQHYIPDDPKHYLDEDDIIADMHFVEWEDEYDQATWLYNELDGIPEDCEIIYCFDW